MSANETTEKVITMMSGRTPKIDDAHAISILKSPLIQEYVRHQIDLAITAAQSTSPPEL